MGIGPRRRPIVALKKKDNVEAVAVADVWKTRAEAGAKAAGAPTPSPITASCSTSRRSTT